MENKKIIMLAGKGRSTNILYNALKTDFDIAVIVLEEPVNKKSFLKNRIKKLGLWEVFGQIIFQVIIVNILNITSTKRIKEIVQQYQLNDSPIPEEKIIHVNSVNDNNCLSTLQNIDPGLIIVNGTRIISKKILEGVKATFINMHVGITPMYRGVHGGYWALVNNDRANFGVTIHIVDAGIDTGTILFQNNAPVTKADNFVTYPLLQLAGGIPYMKKAITDFLEDTITPKKSTGETKLWYHPTIWQYLYYRFKKGIR
jgi:folate-dependent phosphoribosylglycinamide formyltransferase PurN